MHKEIRQVIENSHLFGGLAADLISDIEGSVTRRKLGPGEVLFQKGDPADALWGVLSGRIVLEARADDGKEMVLDDFGEGEVFGEVGVLDFGPRRVEARAAEPSELFRLERKHLLKHLQSSPELCFRVFALLCSHLRDTTENLEDTALYKLPNRLAKRINILAAGSDPANGAVLNIGQSELATMLGVNREAVNRHLRTFEKEGLITLARQQIQVKDPEGLSEVAAPGRVGLNDGWGSHKLAAQHAFVQGSFPKASKTKARPHEAGLLAVDAAEYSRALMLDAARTLKRIRSGLEAVEQAIQQYRGHIVFHTGDRILAEFPDVEMALEAALFIQDQTDSRSQRSNGSESLFRMGVHGGEVIAEHNRFLGDAVNAVIALTRLSDIGGVALSGGARDQLRSPDTLQLQYLGEHELKNVPGTVPVYSARALPLFKLAALRAGSLLPRRFRPLAAVATLAVVLAVVWFAGDRLGRQSVPLTVSNLSIAVLPFAASEASPIAFLSEGLAEDIRSALSLIPGMRVIGGESSGYYRDSAATADEIGRNLQVAWLLRGSVEGSRERPETRAQLTNAVNGEVAWEVRFSDADATEVGSLIARRVAVSLGVSEAEGSDLPQIVPLTRDSEAHALYLEAQRINWLGRQRFAVDALPLLEKAVALDPSFAEAHALLALMYSGLNMLDRQAEYNPEIRAELARQAIQSALALKPDSSVVLSAAGALRAEANDSEGAMTLMERALRINPNNTRALRTLLVFEMQQDDWVSALETSQRMLSLEPLSIAAMGLRERVLQTADRHGEILEIVDRALSFYPVEKARIAHFWGARAKLKLGNRIGAIQSSRISPSTQPYDLWTGLERDWSFGDEVIPLAAAIPLAYDGQFDRAIGILADHWQGATNHPEDLRALIYFVSRGELEILSGDIEGGLERFEKAVAGVPEGSDLIHTVGSSYTDWGRQSHYPIALLQAYRKTGQHDKADILAAQWEAYLHGLIDAHAAVSDMVQYRWIYTEAQFHAVEGRIGEAMDRLQTWLDLGTDIFTYIRWDPLMENLRGRPEFESLVAEVEARLAAIRAEYHAREGALAKADKN